MGGISAFCTRKPPLQKSKEGTKIIIENIITMLHILAYYHMGALLSNLL